jgi:hypothetical protein
VPQHGVLETKAYGRRTPNSHDRRPERAYTTLCRRTIRDGPSSSGYIARPSRNEGTEGRLRPIGPSAVAGSNAVTAAIAEHEAAVVSATAALKSAKAAVDNLAESEDWGTASWPRISPNDRPRPEQSASLKVG